MTMVEMLSFGEITCIVKTLEAICRDLQVDKIKTDTPGAIRFQSFRREEIS